MSESKTSLTGISKAHMIEEIADFWDSHDLGDFWSQTEERSFEVRAVRRRRITLEPELYKQIEARARTVGLLPETLVNVWLAERLAEEEAA